MNSMHYAVYFDAAESVRVLAEKNPSLIMSTCSTLCDRTSLHLAAANLSLQAGRVLVSGGGREGGSQGRRAEGGGGGGGRMKNGVEQRAGVELSNDREVVVWD